MKAKKLFSACLAIMLAAVLFTEPALALSSTDGNTPFISTAGTPGQSASQSLVLEPITGINESTVLGADFSQYTLAKKWNKQFQNYRGEIIDNLFDFVKSQGINTISVKLAVNPGENEENLSLASVTETIREAESAELRTNLVLLYSDSLTYRDNQTLPAKWPEGAEITDSDNDATKALEYTKYVLNQLKTDGALPDIVTVGNQVNWNFLNYTGDDGWKGFKAMGDITSAIKEFSSEIETALSFAMPDQPDGIQYYWKYFDDDWYNFNCDYLGIAVYYDDSTVSSLQTLADTFASKNAASAKDMQLILSCLSLPAAQDGDNYINSESQSQAIYNCLSATVSQNNGGGIIYEKPLWSDGRDGQPFFNEYGHAYTSLATFAYAQGNKTDVSTWYDPFQYGGEPGLKGEKVTVNKLSRMSDTTIKGMDISSYIALRDAGVKYYDPDDYDPDGNEKPLLQILSEYGINYIRIRIWNDPKNASGETYGGGNNDVEVGLKLAEEAKKYNIKLLLCYHYSDFWAAPAQQILPKAWEKDSGNESAMAKNYYNFTKSSLQEFEEAGADIGMVQIGNEITNGIPGAYHKKGEKAIDFWKDETRSKRADRYLKAGIKAVREVSPKALVALHLETPTVEKYTQIMNDWERDKVDYDVLGSSYYPFWCAIEKKYSSGKIIRINTPENLTRIQNLAASYGKLFAVMETSWPHTLCDSDGMPNRISESTIKGDYAPTPQGQVDMLSDMYKVITSRSNGLGAFYWEPGWIPVYPGWINWKANDDAADDLGTGWAGKGALGYFNDNKMYYEGEPAWGGTNWENQALFDMNGCALQSLKFYRDSVSQGKTQTTVIRIKDTSGKIISHNRFARVIVGKTTTVTLPEVSGYIPSNGSYKLTVTGKKEGVSYVTATYKARIRLSKAKATCTSSRQYTGYRIKPAVKVTYNGKTLKKGTDYTVSYSNNRSIGKAKITIKGKGKYIGTKTIYFKITKRTHFAAGIYKVKTSKAPVYSGPSSSHKKIATYKKGRQIEVVKVYQKKKNSKYRYLKIKTGKKYGYISSRYVRLN